MASPHSLFVLAALALLAVGCGGSQADSAPLGIGSVTPGIGSLAGGLRVEVVGSGFTTGVRRVYFGGAAATDVEVESDFRLHCTTPLRLLPGLVDLAVETRNSAANLLEAFEYVTLGPPVLAGLAPISGGLSGGTLVTIAGRGFTGGSLAVWFGGVPAMDVQVVDDSRILCRTPPGEVVGAVSLAVSTANGADEVEAAFTYENLPLSERFAGPYFVGELESSRVDLVALARWGGWTADGAGSFDALYGENAAGGVTEGIARRGNVYEAYEEGRLVIGGPSVSPWPLFRGGLGRDGVAGVYAAVRPGSRPAAGTLIRQLGVHGLSLIHI